MHYSDWPGLVQDRGDYTLPNLIFMRPLRTQYTQFLLSEFYISIYIVIPPHTRTAIVAHNLAAFNFPAAES